MDMEEANKKAKKIYEDWSKKREHVETEAKENGTWIECGLDSNNSLFANVDAEAKAKLKELLSEMDEE